MKFLKDSAEMDLKPLFLKTFFITILVLLIAGVGKYLLSHKPKLPFSNLPADIQFRLKDGASESDKRVAYSVTASDIQGEAILFESTSVSGGQNMVDSLLVGAKGIFETSRAAYAGHITAMIDCPSKKYLKEETLLFRGKETKLLLGVSGNQRSFGTCAIEQMTYTSALWAAYDEKTKQVISIKLFKPLTHLQQVEESQQQILQVLKKIMQ